MKHLIAFLFVFMISCTQPKKNDLEPYLFAISVSNLDSSYEWYTNNLGFKLKMGKYEELKKNFQQVNVIRENLEISLFHDDTAISRKQVIEEYRRRPQGFLQIGFHVSNFDEWEQKIKANNIKTIGSIIHDPFSAKRTIIITDPDNNMIVLTEK